MPRRPGFAFPAATLDFLADLSRHNDKAWFDANRDRYQAAYVEPAKAFVEAIAPALETIVPGIRAEPKVLGSIFRINRDTRFSTDKCPYKEHLDFWFWEGDRRAAVSGLFLRVAPAGLVVGAGAHGFDKSQLARYRAAVTDAALRAELTDVVVALERGGHTVDGESYSRTPPGYNGDHPAARLLRHGALHVHADLPAAVATGLDLLTTLTSRWRTFAPLHRWLVRNVQAS
jgi:uncharacterized protein (TIGR02453 family)